MTALAIPRPISGTPPLLGILAGAFVALMGGFLVSRVDVESPPGEERTESEVWPNGTVAADSCSQVDVSTAITASVDGQIVTIPSGSCTWTTGISTSKQINIRAASCTQVDGGSATQAVVLTHNASGNLLTLTSGSTYHIGLACIQFALGTADTNFLRLSGTGSKVPLIHDVVIPVETRGGTSQDIASFAMLGQGGVVWNTQLTGTDNNSGSYPSLVIKPSSPAWDTASTMGAADTNGTVNLYMEDSTIHGLGAGPDVDHAGRFVLRYSTTNCTWGTNHGPSSGFGGRHVEYYHNTMGCDDNDFNHGGRHYWLRGGTGVFWSNVVNNVGDTQEFGNISELILGEEGEIPGAYPDFEGPGFGHDGDDYVSDPVWMWDETGARAYTGDVQDDWDAHIVAERDFFPPFGGPNPGAKPGYSPFTYPHSARYVQ